MWISRVEFDRVRCFLNEHINFSEKINVITGPNNSGKSTIVKSIALLQYPSLLNNRAIASGHSQGEIRFFLKDCQSTQGAGEELNVTRNLTKNQNDFGHILGISEFPHTEPSNFIYPYFSNRKIGNFEEKVNENKANTIPLNLSNISAKLSVIGNPEHPCHEYYKEACKEFLGFVVTNIPSGNGQLPGVWVGVHDKIYISEMGEGVTNLVGFIVNLAIAEKKLFLIEEPENDIHPRILKSLLKLIAASSKNNQFVVSTHSNIVLKQLGSGEEAKVFNLKNELDGNRPMSWIRPVTSTEERQKTLEDLGYEYFDDSFFNAWIFLEESSAERIIRDYLIPWFVPGLEGKVRTFSANSANKVQKKFEDFNSLFVFLHLEPKYKNRAWVIVDSGEDEGKVIENLKKIYVEKNEWSEDRFRQLSNHDFESYYPVNFSEEIQAVTSIADKQEKRTAKKELLEEVIAWLDSDEVRAKEALRTSAREIIEILESIQSELF